MKEPVAGRILIVGASGHGKVVADVAEAAGYEVIGFLDRDASKAGASGVLLLGPEESLSQVIEERGPLHVFVAIGDNHTRATIVERVLAEQPDVRFPSLVHPAAVLARGVEIGPGSVVMAGAVLNPGVRVGAHCIVNTGALVDHDCHLSDFCTISPGACLGGNVRVDEGAVVALGASIIHGVTVGAHAVLAAGAVAVGDVPARTVSVGVPARVLRERVPEEPYL